ncbi:hypothetical protein [Streptomyces inhibens]|uniref:hypothetical protein n=1 Tax=Streptomyces inhibens TaxID=2293571 RepID=UPI001EE707F8|nr:hypothetical protein [Streptomyces inhibens]UKY54803.1 hypothetical protein KI385_42495 [Streptomyces inhibens]
MRALCVPKGKRSGGELSRLSALLRHSTGGPHDGDHHKVLGLPGVMGDPSSAAAEALRIWPAAVGYVPRAAAPAETGEIALDSASAARPGPGDGLGRQLGFADARFPLDQGQPAASGVGH